MSQKMDFSKHEVYAALSTLELYVSITQEPGAEPLDEDSQVSVREALRTLRKNLDTLVALK
ncbi:MAG: hypothetical protein IOD12_03940 [Silvanigrellales bacterium]|jgi:hypothetical protein|nr:hypothetical protein [Silvanigrellales bacterium]